MKTKRFLTACSFLVLCFIIQGCFQQGAISSLAEYKEKRSGLIEKIRGETESLNSQEKKASEKFEILKRQIYSESLPAAPLVSKPFYDVKDEIANTQLYKVIQQMPKGSILHIHPSAMGNLQTAIDKAIASKNASLTNGLNKTELLKSITIGPEDESIVDIWPEFEQIFGRMHGLIVNYPYEDYLYDAIEYFATKDNISHLEVREHSPRQEDIERYKRIEKRLADNGIDISIRLIYCDSRRPESGESPDDRCAKLRQSADNAISLMEKYPDMVSGFDIYAEEDKGLPASLMADLLIEAKQKAAAKGIEFNLYLHDGESIFPISFNAADQFDKNIPKYYNNNVIDAYLLDAKRVGHGFELAKLPRLAEYYREHKICVELCPISNQLLRYFKDMRNHPGISLFNQGVPITISPDDPAIFGYQGVSFDYWAAVMAWDLSLADVKKCIINSMEYSSLAPPQKNELMKKWQKKWNKFIEELAL
ncbi:MAG: hypothetical protein WC770_05015 [Phycisphaerae bacterium]